MKKNYIYSLVLLGGVFLLSGCSVGTGGGLGSQLGDGGMFKSIDTGNTWGQVVEVLATQGQILRFLNEDIREVTMDPQDHNAVFVGTKTAGLLYSYDGGLSWTQDPIFSNADVKSVAIDHFDKCKWVIALPTKVYRTLDCGRGWREMLTEPRQDYIFKEIITDHFNRNFLYVANNREIIKSTDYGETWKTLVRFSSDITDILMDRNDSRMIYVTFWGGGIQKSTDGGLSWKVVSDSLSKERGGANIRTIVQDLTIENAFFIVNDYGIFKTLDAGTTWTSLSLLTPPDSVDIWGLGLDPKDSNIIYYATDTTFYKTHDGGENWKTSRLPTQRRPSALKVDYKDGNVLYLGTTYVGKGR